MPARLRPSTAIAADAVLVGDPGRALMLAQQLLVRPRMSNHARGLWGYSGETPKGRELTVQSTGIGGPSAAAVLADLAELGLRRAVRVGTCVALDPAADLGALFAVERALAGDGVSRALGAGEAVEPDAELFARLADAARPGAVACGDLDAKLRPPRQPAAGAPIADLQTAALLATAAHLRIAAAALLIVAESTSGERIPDGALEDTAVRAGRAAAAALST